MEGRGKGRGRGTLLLRSAQLYRVGNFILVIYLHHLYKVLLPCSVTFPLRVQPQRFFFYLFRQISSIDLMQLPGETAQRGCVKGERLLKM